MREFILAAVAFPSYSETAARRAGGCSSLSSLPQGCGLGTNRLAHSLQSPEALKKRQLVGTRGRWVGAGFL